MSNKLFKYKKNKYKIMILSSVKSGQWKLLSLLAAFLLPASAQQPEPGPQSVWTMWRQLNSLEHARTFSW